MPRPPRQTAREYDPRVMQLFDQYVHGLIDRRGFLQGASALAFSASAAVGLLASLSPRFAEARQVPENDPRLALRHVEFESPKGHGKGRGYLARLAGVTEPLPTVLVIHENRGLNPHIAGVEGGNGRMGAIGFCYGGAIANFLATRLPDLRAAIPFYGSAAPIADVPAINAALLVVLASDDERVNAGWPAYEEALKAAGKSYRLLQPADTLHGFHNDTTPRYAPEAAREAWQASLALFGRTLKG